ncbi:aquaporin [Streptomyces sp. NPDC003233]
MLAVSFCMAHARYARLVPCVIGLSVALVIAFLRPRCECSINPARQFGPASFSGQTTDLRICLVAPDLGVALGAWLHDLLSSCGGQPTARWPHPGPERDPAGARLTGRDHGRGHCRGQCEWAVACRAW